MELIKKMSLLGIKAKKNAQEFLETEKGDTNFISILVLLGIALALAGVFLAFKDQIINWVDTNIGSFFSKSGGR
ncbi:MAG: flagellin-like protein [Lachnospiraceae bacterium]|nr:flagellin-like protein [Lachnospiraceae bacterium]